MKCLDAWHVFLVPHIEVRLRERHLINEARDMTHLRVPYGIQFGCDCDRGLTSGIFRETRA